MYLDVVFMWALTLKSSNELPDKSKQRRDLNEALMKDV